MISILIFGRSGLSITNRDYLSKAIEELEDEDVKVYPREQAISALRNVRKAENIIWTVNHISLSYQLIALLMGRRCLVVVHNPNKHPQTSSRIKNLIISATEYASRMLASKWLFLSENTSETYDQKKKATVLSKVFPFGLPGETPREREFDLGFIGRNLPYKGLDLLYKALQEIPGGLRVVVAGQGVKRSSGVKQAGEAAKIIDQYLAEDDYKNLFLSCKRIVIPYLKVSQSGPLADAIEAGCSVICSDLRYFKEFERIGGIDFFKAASADSLAQVIEDFDYVNWSPPKRTELVGWRDVVIRIKSLKND